MTPTVWTCGHWHKTRGEAIRCLAGPQTVGFTEDATLELGEARYREQIRRSMPGVRPPRVLDGAVAAIVAYPAGA